MKIKIKTSSSIPALLIPIELPQATQFQLSHEKCSRVHFARRLAFITLRRRTIGDDGSD